MGFTDRIRISLAGGSGGRGLVHFQKTRKSPRSGPDGGDGGKGGDLILAAHCDLQDLSVLKSKKNYKAEDGKPGDKNKKKGLNGKNFILYVPVGTCLYSLDGRLVADVSKESFRQCILKGGKGGRGNCFFKTARLQAPQKAQSGEVVLKKEFILELRWISDIALVGFRGIGKTKLALILSGRREKLYPSFSPRRFFIPTQKTSSFCLVDLPGLSKSSLKFLKQAERTKKLILLVSLEKEDPFLEYQELKEKIRLYDETYKSSIKLKNKILLLIGDPTKENIHKVQKFYKQEDFFEINKNFQSKVNVSNLKQERKEKASVFSFFSLGETSHIHLLKQLLF